MPTALPLTTWETNIRGTYLLFEAIRRHDVETQQVVWASSDKAYGSHDSSGLTAKTSHSTRSYPLRRL